MNGRQGWAVAVLMASALWLPGCDGDQDVTTPSVDPITVSLSTAARATISCPTDPRVTCTASVPLLTVVSTTGAPVTVTRVSLALQDTILGRTVEVTSPQVDGDQIRSTIGTNQVRSGFPLGITQNVSFPVGRVTNDRAGGFIGVGSYRASVRVTGLRDGVPVETGADVFITDF